MFYPVKEKSWSVLLIKGYVFNDQVRAERCENCKSITEALTANHHNPNLILYGCKDSKCKHRMVRLDFGGEVSFNHFMPRAMDIDGADPQTVSSS